MEGVATARYKRATAALDERARERLMWGSGWNSSSSGSDHSGESSPELADLVDAFYSDRDEEGAWTTEMPGKNKKKDPLSDLEVLEGMISGGQCLGEGEIRREVEAALRGFKAEGEEGKRRQVAWWLRQKGFDAGLCKPRLDKNACRFLSQTSHEYIDVVADGGNRYIVELNLSSEFAIARPTPDYLSLLDAFPAVLICSSDNLKEIVGLMCAAAAASMRSRDMHVPPWRRKEYMLAKWMGPYKRTTNRVKEEVVVAPAPAAASLAGSYYRAALGCRGEWQRGRYGLKLKGMYLRDDEA